MKRLFKPLMILTPLAVFASLQFSGPNGEPISSVLDPLLPAKADALCVEHAICSDQGGFYACVAFQYTTCWLNDSASNCWYASWRPC